MTTFWLHLDQELSGLSFPQPTSLRGQDSPRLDVGAVAEAFPAVEVQKDISWAGAKGRWDACRVALWASAVRKVQRKKFR
jgi:hypothetical protein